MNMKKAMQIENREGINYEWKEGVEPRRNLYLWVVLQSDLGESHSRKATSAVASIAAVGGLTEFVFTALWIAYLFSDNRLETLIWPSVIINSSTIQRISLI